MHISCLFTYYPQHLRLHLNFNKWHNNVHFYFIYILIFFTIIVINIIILRIIIIITISIIITIIIFICLFICLFIYLFIYSFIHLFIVIIFFLILFCQQGNSPCIIVLYNGGSKAPIRLSGRGRSCLVCTKTGIFELGIKPKEIHSSLFNLASDQNKTCTWKRGYGHH